MKVLVEVVQHVFLVRSTVSWCGDLDAVVHAVHDEGDGFSAVAENDADVRITVENT